eukprot:Skav230129  [mRNA]  locus=scaffold1301:21412:23012:+ [translate_table: standard]
MGSQNDQFSRKWDQVVPSTPVPKPATSQRRSKGLSRLARNQGAKSEDQPLFPLSICSIQHENRRVAKQSMRTAAQELSHEDYDILLMKAGLRNLLGVEEILDSILAGRGCDEVTHKVLQEEVQLGVG